MLKQNIVLDIEEHYFTDVEDGPNNQVPLMIYLSDDSHIHRNHDQYDHHQIIFTKNHNQYDHHQIIFLYSPKITINVHDDHHQAKRVKVVTRLKDFSGRRRPVSCPSSIIVTTITIIITPPHHQPWPPKGLVPLLAKAWRFTELLGDWSLQFRFSGKPWGGEVLSSNCHFWFLSSDDVFLSYTGWWLLCCFSS